MRKRKGVPVKAEGRSVIAPSFDGPAIKGEGDDPKNVEWVCGICGHVLATNVGPRQFVNIAIKCFKCGTVNDVTE